MATAQTTTRLRLAWRDRARAYLAQRDPLVLIAAACVPIIALLIAASAIRGQLVSPAVASAPTPMLPIIIVATARAEALPTPLAQPAAYQPPAVRYVVAFAAPNGDVLGPIVAPQVDAITGRWGDNWLSTLHDGATVWIRVADLGANLANLAPAPASPAPQVVYIASQPLSPVEAVPTPAARLAPPPVDERQLNIQNHYANEHIATSVPITPPTDVEKEWIRVESCTEHPDWCK
jgi:hypothetical protein